MLVREIRLGWLLRNTWRLLAVFTIVALCTSAWHEVMLQRWIPGPLGEWFYGRLDTFGLRSPQVPPAVLGALGSALAIILAVRNNTSYDRWWEARKLWGGVVNHSRSFARQVLTFVRPQWTSSPPAIDVAGLHRELVLRQAAYVIALALHLRRRTDDWSALAGLLPDDEREALARAENVPLAILQRSAERLATARELGLLDDFRHLRLDETLGALTDLQGGCERIKNTPLPRQYDTFPRWFTFLFALVLPLSIVPTLGWATVLVSVPISGVFVILEGSGRVIEHPFEDADQDTPMTALGRTIERNLRALLGDVELPPPILPVDGVLK